MTDEESFPVRGYEVIGLGLFTLGLLLLFGVGSRSGVAGVWLYRAIAFLVGAVGARIIAGALVALGLTMVLRRERIEFTRLGLGFGTLLWLFLGMWELALPGEAALGLGFSAQSGGLLGVALAALLRPLVGRTIGLLALALASVCTIGYLTDTPLSHMAAAVGRLAARLLTFAGRSGLRLLKLAGRALLSVRIRWPRQREEISLPLPRRRRKAAQPPGEPPQPPEDEQESRPKPPPRVIESTDGDGDGKPRLELLVSTPEGQAELDLADKEGGEESKEGGEERQSYDEYQLPPISLLSEPPSSEHRDREALANVETLESALASYGIEARVVDVERGPRVTRYEIQLPPGVRVGRVTNLADDLAYALKALAVRVEAPVPGKGVIGIEVPNPEVTFVHLREILESPAAQRIKSKIAFALGRDIAGQPMMADLGAMPHLLIAGATNSGKSVCLNSMIVSLLLRARPDEVKMLLIDPKRVELSLFEGIPHLAAPVAHDAREAAGLLRWAIREMELRYNQFADLGVRNILGWNERAKIDDDIEPFYYLVIVIDELADLMMQAATEFETSICRIAQLARATGIHLVVATQRPSVNVITGTIKANIPSRIAFAVASQVDSRTILDINGAERLVGSGDMLYLPLDSPTGKPVRIQGAYVAEPDIVAVTEFLARQAKPQFAPAALESVGNVELTKTEEADDPMFEKALEFVLATKHASASMLQRKFKLGYTRAARLIDMMEERGYVGPHDGRRPREVYSSPADRIATTTRQQFQQDNQEPDEDPPADADDYQPDDLDDEEPEDED